MRCSHRVRVSSMMLKRACRYFTSSASPSASQGIKSFRKIRPKVHYLDLQNSGLSAIERLCLEEALLRHDPLKRSWAIMGTHDPTRNMHIIHPSNDATAQTETENQIEAKRRNECIIVMGIGGKPAELLNLEKVRRDKIITVKRFSGGGTVVLDRSSLWTTFIGRKEDFPHVEPYPRNIMQWSADDVFQGAFERMKHDALLENTNYNDDNKKSSSSSILLPDFSLRENDYVLGERKMGGNAQTITGQGWLHHTSFLWDYQHENMAYLSLPKKRPDYRGDRDHGDFLVKLKSVYGNNHGDIHTDAATVECEGGGAMSPKEAFFNHVKSACQESFDLEETPLNVAMKILDDELGGMQAWFDGKCRTRIIHV